MAFRDNTTAPRTNRPIIPSPLPLGTFLAFLLFFFLFFLVSAPSPSESEDDGAERGVAGGVLLGELFLDPDASLPASADSACLTCLYGHDAPFRHPFLVL